MGYFSCLKGKGCIGQHLGFKKKKREEIAVFSKKEKSHEGLLRTLFSRRGEAVAALTSKQLWEATAYLHNLGSHSFHQAVHRGLQVTGREPSLMV